MRALRVAFLISLISFPAFAQMPTPGFRLNESKELTPDEIERQKANEEAAKAARAKLPDAKVSSDPWANARTADTPAPKAKAKSTAKQ
jgi:hypothetical protein